MKKVICITTLFFFLISQAFASTKIEDGINKQLKKLETIIGTNLKGGKSLGKKETQIFLKEYVLILQDERGDGEVTYLFKDKEYIRYKDYEEISSGAWRFTKTYRLRIFNDDIKLTWKIKIGKENTINIKPKYDSYR